MTSSTKTRLPILTERSVAEARAAYLDRAKDYEADLQAQLAEDGSYVSCHKGCSNCCYHPVFVTLLEGISLYQYLHENGLWTRTLKEKVKQTADQTHNLSVEVWILSLITCPLLDEKTLLCTAYEARPFSCRVTFSVGDPKSCHPHMLGPGMLPKREAFESVTGLETEILRRHHLKHFRVPLAVGLLYGERIDRGELDLDDAHRALMEVPNGG